MKQLLTNLCEAVENMENQITCLQTENKALNQELNNRSAIYYGSFPAAPPSMPWSGLRTQKVSLENLPWADIAAIGRTGYAPHVFALGDTKTIKLDDGENILVRIVGFNHDQQEDGTLAPISFEMVNVLSKEMSMNERSTNEGGWAQSDLRRFLNQEMFEMLPEDLCSVIRPVIKETSKGGGSEERISTSDLLWIMSEQEHFGRKFWSVGGEGKWYEYYKQVNVSYFKRDANGVDPAWPWLRSPRGSGGAGFCYVNSYGSAYGDGASGSFGVAFGFCV